MRMIHVGVPKNVENLKFMKREARNYWKEKSRPKSLKTSAWWMRKTFEENVEICRQLIRKVLLLNLALVSFAPFHHVPSNHWTPNSGIHFRLTEGTCHRCWCCTAQDGSYWTGSHCLVPCNRGVHESQADWGHKKNHHLVSVGANHCHGQCVLETKWSKPLKGRPVIASKVRWNAWRQISWCFLSFPLVPGLAMLPYMNLRSPFLNSTPPLPSMLPRCGEPLDPQNNVSLRWFDQGPRTVVYKSFPLLPQLPTRVRLRVLNSWMTSYTKEWVTKE